MQEMVTETNEKHGLVNVLANSVPYDDFKNINVKIKEKCRKAKEHDHQLVKVRYINHRGQHERLSRPYMRWAGDPIQMWHFIPGYEYDVPRGLVEEVNDKRKRPMKMSGLLDAQGKPLMKDIPGDPIHEFVSAAI